ncbi:cation:proton antiporter domain-containing protein [Gemmatimonas sp.]
MPHNVDLLLTVAAGLGLAFVFGLLAARLRLPTILGYLLAGVLVGPFTPGFVADAGLASQLAEIGVILLMFGVGLHFSLDDLMAVRRIAIPGAIAQITVATGLGMLMSILWGWSWGTGLVFGLSLSVASTVVLLRALEDRGALDSLDGRIAVGWLIVEDLVTVLALVLLPALAGVIGTTGEGAVAVAHSGGSTESLTKILGVTLLKLTGFLVAMLAGGRRVVPWLLHKVVKTGSRELFTLAVLATALGLAVVAALLFDVSFALGAFFAGVIVSESDFSAEAAHNALPLQDAFAVLFFVSVGMLFDPMILLRQPLELLAVVAIILIGKSLAAFGIVRMFGYSTHTALTISASLAQIGEFSFILAALGLSLGLLPVESQSLIVAGALLSITLNPFVFSAVDPLANWLARHSQRGNSSGELVAVVEQVMTDGAESSPTTHVVLVGAGRVGYPVLRELRRHNIPHTAIEESDDTAVRLIGEGYQVVHGDATSLSVLRAAGLERASLVLVASPDAWTARTVLARAHQLNPGVEVIIRTHSDEERVFLEEMGAARALFGERELAVSMTREALARVAPGADREAATSRILWGEPLAS